MDDDIQNNLTREFLNELHGRAHRAQIREQLVPRLLAVAGIELAKRVPREVRVHIVTTLTYVIMKHEGMGPQDCEEVLGMLMGILVPERGGSWGDVLLQDEIVQQALTAGDRNYERTVKVVLDRRDAERKGMS